MKLKDLITQGISFSDPKRVVLIGSSVTDHPQFLDICDFLIGQNMPFSIPSIRIDGIDQTILSSLKKSGMHTITFAPETGSNRLRLVVGKRITNALIISESKKILEMGFSALKMYFLFGLPSETNEDIDAIINLVVEIAKNSTHNQKLKISLNPFIPKAHTPFEKSLYFLEESNFKTLHERYSTIEQSFRKYPNIELETLSLDEAYLQMLFSLGDTSFAPIIEDYYNASQKLKKYVKSIKKQKNPYSELIISYLERIKVNDFGEQPWNIINQCVSPEILKRSFLKSKKPL